MLRKLTQDAAWLALAAILSRSSTLLASILVIRWLGRECYGRIALLQSTVLMAGGFVGLGFGMAATKLVAEYRHSSPQTAGGVILLFRSATITSACLAGIVLWFSRYWLANELLKEPGLPELIAPGAVLLVLTSWNLYQAGILAGLDQFRATAIANAVSGVVSIPFVVAGTWMCGLQGAVYAQLLGMAISCLIYHWWIIRTCRRACIDSCWTEAKACIPLLVQWGLPAMLLNAINGPTDWISFAILTRQADGISQVGIYSAANQWCVLLRFLPLMMGAALLPLATRAVSYYSIAECRRLLCIGLGLSALISAPPAALVSFLSPTIFRCYGAALADHWPVLATLAGASLFIAVQTTADRFIISFGSAWSSFHLGIARSIVQIIALTSLAGSGALGLAEARLIAFAFGAVACSAFAFKILTQRSTENCEPADEFDATKPQLENPGRSTAA